MVRNVITGEAISTLEAYYSANQVFAQQFVAISPNGKILACGGNNQTIKLYDLNTAREIRNLNGNLGEVSSIAFSSDCKSLVSCNLNNIINLSEVATGKVLCNINTGHSDMITSVAFSPDRKTIATSSRDKKIKIWQCN